MTIWNGITEQGAVVPIQVDAQGRVVVSGGGGVPTDIYGTAKVWGRVAQDGVKMDGTDFSSSRLNTGEYQITFTARSDARYIVLATPSMSSVNAWAKTTYHGLTGFKVFTYNSNGTTVNSDFDFALFDFEPVQINPALLTGSTLTELNQLKSEVDKLKKAKNP